MKTRTSPIAAAIVNAAKSAPESAKFGDDRVYISDLYVISGASEAMSLAAFKEALVAYHRAGQLSLSRADLVEAMAAEKVEASEATYLSATWHFVNLPE